MKLPNANPCPSVPNPAIWSVHVSNSKTNYVVAEAGSGRKVRQLRETPELLQESLYEVRGKAEKANAAAAIGLGSDNRRYQGDEFNNPLYLVESRKHILCLASDGFPTSGACSENGTAFDATSLGTHPDGPNPGTIQILDGNLLPTSMADRFLQRVWARLDRLEAQESNVSLRDDLRIAKLCILNVERGQSDPWGFAFWTYLGISYPKYLGILAEREAYARLLGPTLAEQLQDPTFLATLEPVARPFYGHQQMDFGFAPKPVPSPRKKRTA